MASSTGTDDRGNAGKAEKVVTRRISEVISWRGWEIEIGGGGGGG
jgi:hypothetical protein